MSLFAQGPVSLKPAKIGPFYPIEKDIPIGPTLACQCLQYPVAL